MYVLYSHVSTLNNTQGWLFNYVYFSCNIVVFPYSAITTSMSRCIKRGWWCSAKQTQNKISIQLYAHLQKSAGQAFKLKLLLIVTGKFYNKSYQQKMCFIVLLGKQNAKNKTIFHLHHYQQQFYFQRTYVSKFISLSIKYKV